MDTVDPTSAAIAYFSGKININFARTHIESLLEDCGRSAKQIKWLRRLDELINTYCQIANQLAETINVVKKAGMDTTHFLNAVRDRIIFIDFTPYISFLSSCDSVLNSISSDQNDKILRHLDIAVGDSQRYTKIIKTAEEVFVSQKSIFGEIEKNSSRCMEDLTNSLSKFPKSEDIRKANNAVIEIDVRKISHLEIVNKVFQTTFENMILPSLSALNHAQTTLSLTLLHLLPPANHSPKYFKNNQTF